MLYQALTSYQYDIIFSDIAVTAGKNKTIKYAIIRKVRIQGPLSNLLTKVLWGFKESCISWGQLMTVLHPGVLGLWPLSTVLYWSTGGSVFLQAMRRPCFWLTQPSRAPSSVPVHVILTVHVIDQELPQSSHWGRDSQKETIRGH